MEFEEQNISYPPVHPGTDRTFIRFYDSQADLNTIFYSQEKEALPKRIFVTDTNVASLPEMQNFINLFRDENFSKIKIEHASTGKKGGDTLLILGSGEPYKTIESVLQICKTAIDSNAQRSSVFVGIGGGVITDMTAFASSIFKRGANLELVPTTLLSMVDAAIGGKTGCDFDSYKNMIGSFFPAQKIHIIPSFIKSLPQSEYKSGLAEVLKTALLYSSELFEKLNKNPESVADRTSSLVYEMIKTCVNAKANVVEKDLTEKNIRMQLNLGHTFAHALESRAGLGTVSHGDAVAWGMMRAAELSKKIGLATGDYVQKVKSILEKYSFETSAVHSALESVYSDEEKAAFELFSAMQKDKKNSSGAVKFVLQEEIEKTVITEVPKEIVLQVLKR